VRCYQALVEHYPSNLAMLSLLPLSARDLNDTDVLLRAVVQRNFGATHVIAPHDANSLSLLQKHEKDLGIEVIPYRKLIYSEERDGYVLESGPDGGSTREISDVDLEIRLAEGREIPAWFTFPDVATELRKSHPPRSRQGFTVFFTGLSGSGKSTAAKALLSKFLEIGGRSVTLLDGDIVRKNLSSELGFSKEHRNLNILRIGFVANEITKNGGIAICAPIAPYDAIRKQVRELVSQNGGFILVHLSTPLDVCEGRDRKGLYAKARAGIVKEFTGISDPYETPTDAEVVLNTDLLNVEECCQEIRLHLERKGYIGSQQ
jgi:sulfate adenylyltransferase